MKEKYPTNINQDSNIWTPTFIGGWWNVQETNHMDKASTETSAFFRYPAKRISAMKYHTSKLYKNNQKIYSSI